MLNETDFIAENLEWYFSEISIYLDAVIYN